MQKEAGENSVKVRKFQTALIGGDVGGKTLWESTQKNDEEYNKEREKRFQN